MGAVAGAEEFDIPDCGDRAAAVEIMGVVPKLSPRQLEALASRICGSDTPFSYRTAKQLDDFFDFAEVDVAEAAGSRFQFTVEVLRSANRGPLGDSQLPEGIERVVAAVLDRREFDDDPQHADAVDEIAELMRPAGATLETSRSGVTLRSTARTKSQEILDQQIHTVFGETLGDEALAPARTHYRKAKRYLEQSEPDFENASKESVCSIESIVLTLADGADLPTAVRALARRGLIPKPVAEMIVKLYAYRGNEPGIAHGGPTTPSVGRLEAELLFTLAGCIGSYLRETLTEPD